MTPDQHRFRAAEARRLLDEPLLNEALDALERAAIEELLAVKGYWRADKRRRMLADRVNVVRELRARLKSVIAMGDQAAKGGMRVA